MERDKFTPLELAVWAAAYVRQLDRFTERKAAVNADEVVAQLRKHVVPVLEWGGA